MNMNTTVCAGQVWVEHVACQLTGEIWDRVHYVSNVTHYYAADHKIPCVISYSSDGEHNNDRDHFATFTFTGHTVNLVPCLEQRTLAELEQILDGTYPASDTADVEAALAALKAAALVVLAIGGVHRERKVQAVIHVLQDILRFVRAC